MMDKILSDLNASTIKLIDDVKTRATSIIESAVNLSIDGGKKRLDELREILKSESDMLEQRIKVLKNTSMADIDQRSNEFFQKIQEMHQKLIIEKNEIDQLLKSTEDVLKKFILNSTTTATLNLKTLLEEKKTEATAMFIEKQNEWLPKLEKEFENKLDDIIYKNKGQIIKSIIKAIFTRRKTQ